MTKKTIKDTTRSGKTSKSKVKPIAKKQRKSNSAPIVSKRTSSAKS